MEYDGFMKEVKSIRQKLGKLRKQVKGDGGLLDLVEELIELHVRLVDRVAALEKRPGNHSPSNKPAKEGTPGQRKEVNRDVAGKKTGEPKRTEKATGRNEVLEGDMERGII